MIDLTIQNKIIKGEIDINNQELFMSALFKALLYKLNNDIQLRTKKLPHFILNTGDDIMYLEVKGQDQSKEPLEQNNENYVYTSVPRCVVDVSSLEVLEDQLTSPYNRGNFEIAYDDNLYGFSAEFRRMPLKLSVSLKYYLDSFTDSVTVTQQIISKLLFIQNFSFTYMGQTMFATYKVPTSYNTEKMVSFDGGTTDSKLRTIGLDLEVETNMPIFEPRTAICGDYYIKKGIANISANGIKASSTSSFPQDGPWERYIEELEKAVKDCRKAKNILNELLRVEGKQIQPTTLKASQEVIKLQDEVVQIIKQLNGPWNLV